MQDSGGIVSDNALKIPLLGFAVTNSPLSVRPIAGSPGAMVLGGAIPLPAGVSSVIPIPGQQFAIVEQAGGSGVLTLDLSTPQNVSPIAGSFAHSDRIAFSPSGSVAALYSSAAHQAQVITGLPASAQISRTVDLSAAGAAVTSLAISDDGQALLAGVSDGMRGAIWSFAAGQTASSRSPLRVFPALRFSRAGMTPWLPIKSGSKCC